MITYIIYMIVAASFVYSKEVDRDIITQNHRALYSDSDDRIEEIKKVRFKGVIAFAISSILIIACIQLFSGQ